ncbi:unnamed protein product [Sphenostylis stenocarpa]|uniref:Uncharacterized protein n=1 Tax=Sphenostylis stenocarpa TaxID=92480 RepID=A0AA86T286_9FABA|nr:unnamed protein product [Sphenostylis stenocarpa]
MDAPKLLPCLGKQGTKASLVTRLWEFLAIPWLTMDSKVPLEGGMSHVGRFPGVCWCSEGCPFLHATSDWLHWDLMEHEIGGGKKRELRGCGNGVVVHIAAWDTLAHFRD